MKANRKFTKDDEAVSPVIGVILMVAITVILAAVIAAFVFGMGGSLSKQYVVACTVSQVGDDTINVVYQGGPDHVSLSYINVSVAGTECNNNSSPKVGDLISCTNGTTDRDHVIVTGTFTGGTTQVLVDTYV